MEQQAANGNARLRSMGLGVAVGVATALLSVLADAGLWPASLLLLAPACAAFGGDRVRKPSVAAAALAGLLAGVLPALVAGPPVSAGALLAACAGPAVLQSILFAALLGLRGLPGVPAVLGAAAFQGLAVLAASVAGLPVADIATARVMELDEWLSGIRAVTPAGDLLAMGGVGAVGLFAGAASAGIGLALGSRRRLAPLGTGMVVLGLMLGLARQASLHAPLRTDAAASQPLRVSLVQQASEPSTSAARLFEAGFAQLAGADTEGAALMVWAPPPGVVDAGGGAAAEGSANRAALTDLARRRSATIVVGGGCSGEQADRAAADDAVQVFAADGSEGRCVSTPASIQVGGWKVALLPTSRARDRQVAAGTTDAPADVAHDADLLLQVAHGSPEGDREDWLRQMAPLAAEARRPAVIVRSAGGSGLVTRDGLVAWRLPAGSSAFASLDVPPSPQDPLATHGGRAGVAMLLVLVAGAAVVLGWVIARG